MKTHENPYAFPSTAKDVTHMNEEGMTLRDYFAGQVIAGFCANPSVFASRPDCGWSLCNCTDSDLVGYAGSLADQMLAERVARAPKGGAA
jgi:hypothetical protein